MDWKRIIPLPARRTAALLVLCAVCGISLAQDIDGLLPAKFVRIRTLEDLKAGGFYLIGSYGVNQKHFYLLSNTARKKKFAAMHVGDAPGETIENERAARVWTVERNADGTLTILAAPTGRAVFAGTTSSSGSDKLNDDGTDLGTSEKVRSAWNVSVHDGLFKFSNANQTNRFLSLSEYTTSDSYFGNFVRTEANEEDSDLYLFKLASFGQTPGTAAAPTDGARVIVGAADYVAGGGFAAEDASDYLLCNGEVAPADGLTPLTAVVEGTGRFSLRNAGGAYLSYALQFTADAAEWAVANGYVVTTEATPRYLVLVPAEARFAVMEADAAEAAKAVGVVFRQVGVAPSSTLNNGLLTLAGAWDARRLAAIDCTGADALDLSGISLPQHARPFDGLPDDRNFPIYTNKEDAAAVPDAWPFVVSGGKLLRRTLLADRLPLRIPKPFTAEAEDLLVYERTMAADGMWETLFLPFATAVPEGFHAELLRDFTGDALVFEQVREIPANTPAIIRPRGTATASGTKLRLGNLQGNVMTNASSTPGFSGTYQPLTVVSASENIYLLNEAGDTFVHADAGSRLAPFRGYLNVGGAPAQLPIPVTAIRQVTTAAPGTAQPAYTIDGRRAADTSGWGIYITGGRKTIRH